APTPSSSLAPRGPWGAEMPGGRGATRPDSSPIPAGCGDRPLRTVYPQRASDASPHLLLACMPGHMRRQIGIAAGGLRRVRADTARYGVDLRCSVKKSGEGAEADAWG